MIMDGAARAVEEADGALGRGTGFNATLLCVAEAFLSQGGRPFDEVMEGCARLVADAADMDIFSLWRNLGGPGDTEASLEYLWDRREGGAVSAGQASGRVPQSELGPPPGSDRDAGFLPDAATMKKFGVKSALAAPICIDNAPWGHLLLADCRAVRCFDRGLAEMMRSAGPIFANSLIRSETMRELAATNETNRTIFDCSLVGLAIFDGGLNFIDCNNTLLELFGVTKEMFKSDFFRLSPEFQPDGSKSRVKAAEAMRRALEGERVVVEWMHRTYDGRPIPCEVTLTPPKHGGKDIVLAYIYDLRNLKKMEEAVSKAEGNIHAITEASPISFILFDEDMHPTDCNDATMAIFGCHDKRSFLDEYWTRFTPSTQPDGRGSVEKAFSIREGVSSYGKIVFDWLNLTCGGDPLPVENTMTQILLGSSRCYIIFKYDLRNIRKMEAALNQAEELTRLVTEASPVTYVLFDKDLRALDCNATALGVFGCPDKKYFLDNYWDKLSPEYQPDGRNTAEKRSAILSNLPDEGKVVYEWLHMSHGGEDLPMENTLTPLFFKGQKYIISFMYDLRHVKRLEQEVEKIFFDPLTDIYNRRYFDETLKRTVKAIARTGGSLSILMIDLDSFKSYNDTYGHAMGDACLKAIAKAIQKSVLRGNDFVARYGGEEFVVVLPNTDEAGACIVAEKMLEDVRACNIAHENNYAAGFATISIGTATGLVGQTLRGEDFVKRADEMLYKSKKLGGNRNTFGAV